MKIAVVVPVIWDPDPTRFSADPRFYVRGFEELGHEVLTVCLEGSEPPPNLHVMAVSAAQLAEPSFWRRLGLDMAVVYTWATGFHGIVLALRAVGVFVVSKVDSDGKMGVRAYPRATAVRAVLPARSPVDAARRSWHWSKRYAYLYKDEDAALLRNLAEADATIVESPVARDNLLRLLSRYDALPQASRLHTVRQPVDERYCSGEVGAKRDGIVVSVGRWADPAKNAALLRRTLALLPDGARAIVVGPDGDRAFGGLSNAVRYTGLLPGEELVEIYAQADVFLASSRYEGCLGAGLEALAMGCTVVGPGIPAIESMVLDGSFGVVASRPRASALADALASELARWHDAERDPQAIAAHWRAEVAPAAVAARIAGLIEARPG